MENGIVFVFFTKDGGRSTLVISKSMDEAKEKYLRHVSMGKIDSAHIWGYSLDEQRYIDNVRYNQAGGYFEQCEPEEWR